MTEEESYINERLDHLGIIAGVCEEIGLAAWLDAQDPGNRQQVSEAPPGSRSACIWEIGALPAKPTPTLR